MGLELYGAGRISSPNALLQLEKHLVVPEPLFLMPTPSHVIQRLALPISGVSREVLAHLGSQGLEAPALGSATPSTYGHSPAAPGFGDQEMRILLFTFIFAVLPRLLLR